MTFEILAQDAARCGPLFIVINAASGRHEEGDVIAALTSVFTESGREFEFLEVTEPAHLPAQANRAVALAKARRGVVVAAGGDGTINTVASAVLGSDCPFGVLPQGTFNYFARSHAIPQETLAAARALLRASISPVQVGRVNGRLFLVNASLGLYPRLLEDREAWKQQFGRSRLVAFAAGLASVFQARGRLDLQIETAGRAELLRTLTLFVGNNHLQLARAGIAEIDANAVQQGQLAGIVLRPIGTLALFGLLLRGLLGRLGDADNVHSFSFRRLSVMPRGRKRIKVATDGEVGWMPTPLVFEVASERLMLLVPTPDDRAEVA